MGFVALLLVGCIAAALLWRLRLAPVLWSMAGAALMLGATGYAITGRALLPGHPTRADSKPVEVNPGLVALREEVFGRFTADAAYLTAGDAMLRAGDTGAAVQVMLGGIRSYPGSAELWTGLGSTLAAHDGGRVSPPALLAFQRAIRFAPRHPGPPLFAGIAYARAGNLDEARAYWLRALALTPPAAGYRPGLVGRLSSLDLFVRRKRPAGG